MIRRVRAGQTVVRLKAGDPFVFGRGAEEVDALQAAGLPVTVVPGITAALGCAASAGIPLTDRRVASAVTFVIGPCRRPRRLAALRQSHTSPSTWAPARPLPCATVCWPPAPIPTRRSPSSRTARGPTSGSRPAVSPTWRGSPLGHTPGDAGPSLIIVGEVAARAAAERASFAEVS